jgi:topoisomerase-4 subunit A
VVLISEHDDAEDVPDPEPDSIADTEIIITPENKTSIDVEPKVIDQIAPLKKEDNGFKTEDNNPKTTGISVPKSDPVEPPQKPVEPPPKKVDFEITNPDDIDIDDKGQLGLF